MPPPMLPKFHPERQNQIEYNRRPECEKGCVDEIYTDTAGRKIQFFTQLGTNPKNVVLYKITDTVIHTSFRIKTGQIFFLTNFAESFNHPFYA